MILSHREIPVTHFAVDVTNNWPEIEVSVVEVFRSLRIVFIFSYSEDDDDMMVIMWEYYDYIGLT